MFKRASYFFRSRIWRLLNIYKYAKLARFAFVEKPFLLTGVHSVSLGKNVKIWPFARIEVFAGSKSNPALKILDNTVIQPFSHIAVAEKITIGRHCLIASHVYITDHDHNIDLPRSDPSYSDNLQTSTVVLGDYVWVGEKVNILKGVTIGESSIIGAGSTVTKDIPPYSIALGCPARVVKTWDSQSKAWIKVT